LNGVSGNGSQPLHAFCTTWRTLVDTGLTGRDGLGVGQAIGVTAAFALGLGEDVMDTPDQRALHDVHALTWQPVRV